MDLEEQMKILQRKKQEENQKRIDENMKRKKMLLDQLMHNKEKAIQSPLPEDKPQLGIPEQQQQIDKKPEIVAKDDAMEEAFKDTESKKVIQEHTNNNERLDLDEELKVQPFELPDEPQRVNVLPVQPKKDKEKSEIPQHLPDIKVPKPQLVMSPDVGINFPKSVSNSNHARETACFHQEPKEEKSELVEETYEDAQFEPPSPLEVEKQGIRHATFGNNEDTTANIPLLEPDIKKDLIQTQTEPENKQETAIPELETQIPIATAIAQKPPLPISKEDKKERIVLDFSENQLTP
jgi:hypothetical protein